MTTDARTRAPGPPPRNIVCSEAVMEYQIQTRRPRTRDVVLRELTNAHTKRNHAADSLDLEVYRNLVGFIDHLLGELFKLDQVKT
jgi:hypothetical protein